MSETRPGEWRGKRSWCVTTPTIGQAWLQVAAEIMSAGAQSSYDGLAIRELLMATLEITEPDPADTLIDRYAEPERLAWMHANFTDHARVAALADADSYATRIYDYARAGRDQIKWITERLRADPLSRSATITTFQPLTDSSYVPCVSLLDFFLADDRLHLTVYAHSIDFGAKGYANLVELAALQRRVAADLATPVGPLTMIIKSAHVYATDDAYLSKVLQEHQAVPNVTAHRA
jgi:thymidylate synthase